MSIFSAANILIPSEKVDLEKWAVVACDQFTSQPDYWENVKKIAGDNYSALNLVLPEIYLTEDISHAIQVINQKMLLYLQECVFQECDASYVYVQRVMNDGSIREGLIGQLDLEEYDYSKQSKVYVRATEETIAERIPARVAIRKGATIELPHVIMLCNDEKRMLIEPIREKKETLHKLYDFELMCSGGRITGWLISGQDAYELTCAIEDYEKRIVERNGSENIVYAIGDGNHSLATAKFCYEHLKKEGKDSDSISMARYALVELENIYSEAQKIEPIHRVIFNTDVEQLIEELQKNWCEEDGQEVVWYCGEKKGKVYLSNQIHTLAVGGLQTFLDEYLQRNEGVLDYVHGEEVVRKLVLQENAIGFVLPTIKKEDIFSSIASDGVLPRKTFSMGHANEKRYYLEARRIINY